MRKTVKKAQLGKILKKGIKKGIETASAMRKTPIKEMFQGVGKGITNYQGKDAYGKDIFEKPSNKVKDLFKGFGKGIKDYKEPGKYKKGGKVMLKRADGSYSQRGLWDNIRAKRGSGKKPTAAMLKQERKIKAKSKKK